MFKQTDKKIIIILRFKTGPMDNQQTTEQVQSVHRDYQQTTKVIASKERVIRVPTDLKVLEYTGLS